MKNILVINGSASDNSSNERLIDRIVELSKDSLDITIFSDLKTLPHFDPKLSSDNPPASIINFRKDIEHADGVIICTPEYIFSIPSGLKNAIEWCVSTVVFTDRPLGIITASAQGEKAHAELKMIMGVVGAKFNDDTTLLIQGIKGKVSVDGEITQEQTRADLSKFVNSFTQLVQK